MNKKEIIKLLEEYSVQEHSNTLNRVVEMQDFDGLADELVKLFSIHIVSQQREQLPLFDDRHLQNGIAFTLTEVGKLGKHPESKLVSETTLKLKQWILENFELKKR